VSKFSESILQIQNCSYGEISKVSISSSTVLLISVTFPAKGETKLICLLLYFKLNNDCPTLTFIPKFGNSTLSILLISFFANYHQIFIELSMAYFE
jgi:hypothetical protein